MFITYLPTFPANQGVNRIIDHQIRPDGRFLGVKGELSTGQSVGGFSRSVNWFLGFCSGARLESAVI